MACTLQEIAANNHNFTGGFPKQWCDPGCFKFIQKIDLSYGTVHYQSNVWSSARTACKQRTARFSACTCLDGACAQTASAQGPWQLLVHSGESFVQQVLLAGAHLCAGCVQLNGPLPACVGAMPWINELKLMYNFVRTCQSMLGCVSTATVFRSYLLLFQSPHTGLSSHRNLQKRFMRGHY